MAVLQVTNREATGHKTKHLRKAGLVPMALTRKKNHEIRLIQGDAFQVRQTIGRAQGVGMVDIQIDGEPKPISVIVKQVDQEYLSHTITNVTFLEVSKDDLITADINVTHVGTPEAVEAGTALLASPNSSLKIRGKVSELPDHIEVDVSGMEIGGHILASDVQLPAGIELISPPDTMLFGVSVAKEPELEVEAAEEGAEPEVVGEEQQEGGAEES
jgi:large subunit ribosomal protein L25